MHGSFNAGTKLIFSYLSQKKSKCKKHIIKLMRHKYVDLKCNFTHLWKSFIVCQLNMFCNKQLFLLIYVHNFQEKMYINAQPFNVKKSKCKLVLLNISIKISTFISRVCKRNKAHINAKYCIDFFYCYIYKWYFHVT